MISQAEAQKLIKLWEKLYIELEGLDLSDDYVSDGATRMLIIRFRLLEAGYRLTENERTWYLLCEAN